jgi:hypothetical protein
MEILRHRSHKRPSGKRVNTKRCVWLCKIQKHRDPSLNPPTIPPPFSFPNHHQHLYAAVYPETFLICPPDCVSWTSSPKYLHIVGIAPSPVSSGWVWARLRENMLCCIFLASPCPEETIDIFLYLTVMIQKTSARTGGTGLSSPHEVANEGPGHWGRWSGHR